MSKLVIPLNVFQIATIRNKKRRLVYMTLNEWINIHGKPKGRMIAAGYKKKIQERIRLYVAQAMVDGLEPINQHTHLNLTWYFENRRIDLDNWSFTHKFILDAFQETSVRGKVFLPNDNLTYIDGIHDDFTGIDKIHPRVEIDWRSDDG